MTREDFEKYHSDQVREFEDICDTLDLAGVMFSGGVTMVAEVAREWMAEDFTISGVREWIGAGFWCPRVASRLYDMGYSARWCVRRAEQLKRDGACEDPIHYMCNGDFPLARFVGEEE